MILDRFVLFRNIGQFDNVAPSAQLVLSPFTVIYAENGRGKTTVATVLRSLGNGDPNLIVERHRLGTPHLPHVVLSSQGNQHVFQNGLWNAVGPDLIVFDDAFVAANVCSGIEIAPTHRQNLHELILGAQGVALNAALQGHVTRIEQHNVDLRARADAILPTIHGEQTVDAFCAIKSDAQIDVKVQEAERRLSAANSQDAIRQRQGFIDIVLPDINAAAISAVLGASLGDLQSETVNLVRTHLTGLGSGGENWVADGMYRIEGASQGSDHEICPFCAQSLGGSSIIQHYQVYFSQAYENLKQTIQNEEARINQIHGGEIPVAFERAVRTAVQTHEFWKDFVDAPEVNLDTAAITREWAAVREGLLQILQAKAASPLEPMAISKGVTTAISTYSQRRSELACVSAALIECNKNIEIVKEQAASADASTLASDLIKLRAVKRRFDPEVASLCDAYLVEKTAKKTTETLRDQARVSLDKYREDIFPAYEDAINSYLQRFNAGFRLGSVASVNTRSGSSASYHVVINEQSVNLTAEVGPCFRNTLSAGDRNTLALAFFFAALEKEPNLDQKVVVVDDPMTSLDEHRALTTIQEMKKMFARVKQMIVLSHSKPFLCALWDGADKNARSAMRLVRAGVGSSFAEWDVNADSITEHDRRHQRVVSYIAIADPANERIVAADLRPILEFFMRVAYPDHFPPGTLLGSFIGICRQRLGAADKILSEIDTDELRALLDYANRFHHDTNPAWETVAINDQELLDFSKRTIKFASRR